MLDQFYFIYLEILEQQRKLLHDMNELSEFDEDIIRKYMGLTDIEELKVREKLTGRTAVS
jgi:CPA1 family monovalent cation:H+ antiporter